MSDVSTFRLWTLRAMYLLMAGGLIALIWPRLLAQPADWPHMNSVVAAMLAGVSLMALLGLRYPVQMIPILLFELVWKALWLVAVALPRLAAGELDGPWAQSLFDCIVGVVLVPLVLPWRHVIDQYIRRPADRWRAAAARDRAPT